MSLFGAVADHYVAAGGGSNTYAATVLADSPMIYLRLGESSGTTAADSSGNSHPGTITNSPTLGVTGPIGDGNTAVTFNGTNQDIDIPNFAGIPANGITMECWVKTTTSATAGVWSRSGDASAPYGTFIVGGVIQVLIKRPTSASLTGTIPVNDGNWHHVAWTLDSTAPFTANLYIDGVLDTSAALGVPQTLSAGFSVASRGTSTFFAGSVDECALYNSVLTSTRIAAHYAAR